MLISTLPELRDLVDYCLTASIIGLDTETRPRDGVAYSGLDVRPYDGLYEDTRSRVAGVCLAYDQTQGFYVPLQHDQGNIDAPPADVLYQFRRLGCALRDKKLLAAMWNSSFDMAMLRKLLGVRRLPVGAWLDGEIMDKFLRPWAHTHGLKDTAKRVLKVEMQHFDAPMREVWVPELDVDHPLHFARRNMSMDFGALDPKDAQQYASEDARVTLAYVLSVINTELPDNTSELVALEHDFSVAVASMQRNQIGYDRPAVLAMSTDLMEGRRFLGELLAEDGLGNPASPVQVLRYLRAKGFKGEASDKAALKSAKGELRIYCSMISEYRRLDKYLSSYVTPLLNADHPSEVMGSWRAWGARSGRMSAGPAKGRKKEDVHCWSTWLPQGQPRDKRMRGLYVARKGRSLISADYSSQEYRLAAQLSGEESWIRVFNSPNKADQDIHAANARMLFPGYDEAPQAKKDELRSIAKTYSFASIYGAQADRIALMLGIDPTEAQVLLDRLFAAAPKLGAFIQESQDIAAQHKRVWTWFGRPIAVQSKDVTDIDDVPVHAATNYRVQGTGSDILRLAVTGFVRDEASRIWTEGGDDTVKLVNLIHDEILVEAVDEDAERCAASLRNCMERVVPESWRVRLPVDVKIVKRWTK